MNILGLGEAAALGTAVFWSFSSVFFTIGGRRVGALVVNRARLLLAVVMLAIAHQLSYGVLLPVDAQPVRIAWLALSGTVGLALGDTLLYQAYVMVGTRVGMLFLATSPIFAAVLAWLALGEQMSPIELLAMVLALAGIAWVVVERSRGNDVSGTEGAQRHYLLGVLCGISAGLSQAVGMVTAKEGLNGGYSPLSGLVIRTVVAMIVIWVLTVIAREVRPTLRVLRGDEHARLAILGGSVVGPVLGAWLAMVSVQAERVGIAATLMAMTPITVLPLVRIVFHERIGRWAIAGTVLAMVGIILMTLI